MDYTVVTSARTVVVVVGDRADHHGYCLRNDPTVAPGIDTHQARLIFTFVI